MSFFGNEVFMQMQNQGGGNGTPFGKGHGTGGFGQAGLNSSGFGRQWSGGAFGENHGAAYNDAQPISINGTHMYAHVGPPVLNKRGSLLTDMTQSKSGIKPVYITSCSLPNGSSKDEDVTVISSLYDKPTEKRKKPPLVRQSSVFSDNSVTRPPSFSSQGNIMRSNTVGSGTMRSVSMTEERTQIMNSDLPMPRMQRRHSFHAHSHKRRYSLFGKSNRSRITPPLTPKSDRYGSQKRKSLTNSEKDQESLILSLMNPSPKTPGKWYTKEGFLRRRYSRDSKVSRQSSRSISSIGSYNSQVSEHSGNITDSPTLVSKKVQHLYPKIIHDEASSNCSVNSSPRSVRSAISHRSLHSNSSVSGRASRKQHESNPKSDPANYKPRVNNRSMYGNPSDSENKRTTLNSVTRTKQYLDKKPRPRTDSTSTCESTSSTDDTPRPFYTKSGKKYNHTNGTAGNRRSDKTGIDDEHEALCVKTIVDQFNKQKGLTNYNQPDVETMNKLKLQSMANSKVQTNQLYPNINKRDYENIYDGNTFNTQIPDVIVPTYVNIANLETTLKDNSHVSDTCAESSESGYTSNKQHSPREYEMKAAHFVNSLPHPQESMKHAGDNDELSVHSNMSSISCESGSESEHGVNSHEHVNCKPSSKEETTKMLASPTLVKEMFDKSMARQTGKGRTLDKAISLQNWQTDSNNSENEHLHLLSATATDKQTVKRPDSRTVSNTNVNTIVNVGEGGNIETRKASHQSIGAFSGRSFAQRILSVDGLRKPQFPSITQTDKTNRLDRLLHLLNMLLFLSSIAVIITAIWLLIKDFNAKEITEIFGNNIFAIIVYVTIVGAGISMLATLCLCCGIRRDKFGLGCYAFVLIIVFIAFALASILSAIFVDRLNGVELKFNFQDRLIARYGNVSLSNTDNKKFTESWDNMQIHFECCGAHGDENDTTSWAVYRKKFSSWYIKQPLKATVYVPESCCVKNKDVAVCQGSNHNLFGPPVYGPPMEKLHVVNPNLNTRGCYDFVAPYLVSLLTMIAVVMGLLAVTSFLVAFLTWMFCLKKKPEFDDPYFSDTYYGDYDDDNDNVFEETNHDETDYECQSEYESRDLELNRQASNDDSRSRTISEESEESNSEAEHRLVNEHEIVDRRDRWYRSDIQMNSLFTTTIEEEDSDIEDNDGDNDDADETVAKKPIDTSF